MDGRPAETSAEHITLAQAGVGIPGVPSPGPAIRTALHIAVAIALDLHAIRDILRETNDRLAAIADRQ